MVLHPAGTGTGRSALQLLLTKSFGRTMAGKLNIALLLSVLVLVACNHPVPDPGPTPDPVTRPVEPDPDPCEIDTTDHGCITLERFNALKADLVAGYEIDTAYNRHFYGRESRLAEAWSNLRLVYGDDTRPGTGCQDRYDRRRHRPAAPGPGWSGCGRTLLRQRNQRNQHNLRSQHSSQIPTAPAYLAASYPTAS